MATIFENGIDVSRYQGVVDWRTWYLSVNFWWILPRGA